MSSTFGGLEYELPRASSILNQKHCDGLVAGKPTPVVLATRALKRYRTV